MIAIDRLATMLRQVIAHSQVFHSTVTSVIKSGEKGIQIPYTRLIIFP